MQGRLPSGAPRSFPALTLFFLLPWSLLGQCPEITTSGLSSPDCYNGSTPCDVCPGDVLTLSAAGTSLPNGGCIDWYYSTTPGFNPYNGEGTFIGCGAITAPPPAPCSTCPEILAIWIDACGSEQANEFMIVSSGSGFNVNNFGVNFDTNNNNNPPSTDDINTGGGSCNWQVPSAGVISSMQASSNCNASNIIAAGPGATIPPGVLVVIWTSSAASTTYNFDALCAAGQTIYVMQSSCARSAGAFSNNTSNGLRTTTIVLNNCNCSNSFTHDTDDPALLGEGDFAYLDNGTVTYGNGGCNNPEAPFVEPEEIAFPPATVANVTYTVPAALCNGGPYYVVGIVDTLAANCPEAFTDEFAFNVICPEPVITVSGTPCTGNTITLGATGGTSFLWSGPAGFSSNLANPSVGPLSAANAGTYSVTVTNAAGCSGTATYDLTVFPDVSVSVSPAAPSFCAGESAVLTATGQGGGGNYTFEWTIPGGSGSGPSIVVNQAGTYSVTLTDANGCQATASGTITVLQGPTVTIDPAPASFCAGNSVTLTAVATGGSGGYTYQWTDPAGNPSFSSTVNASTAGTYSVTVSDSNGCEGSATITVTAKPLPSVALSSDPPAFCPGVMGTVTAAGSGGTGGYTFNWTTPSGPNSGNPISTSDPGTYTVTLTDAGGCTAMDTLVVPAGSPLSLSFNPTPASFCPGGSVNLTVQVQGAQGNPLNYFWNTPAGLATGNPLTVNTPGTYTVTVSEENGCSGTASIPVTVNPSLNIQFQADTVSICPGGKAVLSGTANGGNGNYTYTWLLPGGPVNGNTLNVNTPGSYILQASDSNNCQGTDSVAVIPSAGLPISLTAGRDSLCPGEITGLQTLPPPDSSWTLTWTTPGGPSSQYPLNVNLPGIYILQAADTLGCSGTDTITIGAHAAPLIGIVPPTPVICTGSTVELSVQVNSGGPLLGYSWTTPAGTPTTSQVTAGLAGIYQVTVTNTSGCTGSASATVSFGSGLGVTFDPPTISICTGSEASLHPSVTTGTPPFQFSWAGPSGTSSDDTLKTKLPGIYQVTVTDAKGCSGTGSVTVLTGGSLSVSIQPNQPGFCPGASVSLSANAPGGQAPLNYQWSTPSGSGTQPQFTTTQAGLHSLTITDANGCSGTATVQVSAWPAPSVSIQGGNVTLCVGESTSLTASATAGNAPYQFVWSGSGGPLNGPSFPNATAGSYTVIATDSRGCSASAFTTLSAQPPLVVTLDDPSPVICPGGSVSVTAIPTGGIAPFQFIWNGPGGLTSSGNPASLSVAGNYLLTVTDAKGCSGSVSFSVDQSPAPQVIISATVSTICGDQPYTATAKAGSGVTSIQWNTPQGAFTGPSVNLNKPGLLIVTVTDGNGCASSDSLTIASGDLRVLTEATPEQCPGSKDGTIRLVSLQTGTFPLTASLQGGASPSLSSLPFEFTDLSAGTYVLTLTDAAGCSLVQNYLIGNSFQPSIQFQPDEVTIVQGSSITLDPIHNFISAQFSWSPGAGLSCTDCIRPDASPQETTLYMVSATDDKGCRAEASIRVIVVGNTRVFIPDAFSPNFDGINDIFSVQAADGEVTILELAIYDRWGNALHRAGPGDVLEVSTGWDGTYQGRLLDPGVYVYTVLIGFPDGSERLYKGELTLLR